MAIKDHQNIYNLYTDLKTRWEKKRPEWQSISQFVGIGVDIDYMYNKGANLDNNKDLDDDVDDPTAAISVNQAE